VRRGRVPLAGARSPTAKGREVVTTSTGISATLPTAQASPQYNDHMVVRPLSVETECAVRGLTVAYRIEGTWLRAVRDVSFEVHERETVAIVGETGSGKTSTVHALLRLLPPEGRIVAGSISIRGEDVLRLGQRGMRRLRGREVGYVPQQAMAAFNPTMPIGKQVAEALVVHKGTKPKVAIARAGELLAEMGLPRDTVRAFPHQLSGGMLQRAMIASAIIANPHLLVADEPTSALDVTVQRQIVELLLRIREEHGLSILLVTHDLGAVERLADFVIVLYAGRRVEAGRVQELLQAPRHPYTRALVDSLPGGGKPHKSRLPSVPGVPLGPAEVDAEQACPFRYRCPRALPVCSGEFPSASTAGDHIWFCHNSEPV
jgi:oligopeptide/dipeptide ABC transporter ATP-binding protein